LELTIEKLIYGGDGLSRLPADENGRGKAVFMPFVLEGETVDTAILQQKPGFARARVNNILQPSPHRVEAPCPYFGSCGGCHYQHSSYEHQLEIKASILKENLRRLAKLELAAELTVHPSQPWNYRNRTRLRLQAQPEFALGYYKLASHALQPVEECPISSVLINRAIRALWDLGRAGKVPASIREIELFANAEDERLSVEIYCDASRTPIATGAAKRVDALSGVPLANSLFQELRATLPQLAGIAAFCSAAENSPPEKQTETIDVAGEPSITYDTKHGRYRVSAGSFFQVNRFLTDELIDIVTAGRSGRTALDLYAGVGLFSTVLSREFERVIAVEASQHSAADLAYNSGGNVKTVHATVERYLKDSAGKLRPDLVIVDPPRGGLGENVARSLAAMQAPRLVYVSCDPATLARDISPLAAAGYHVEQAHLVDLFPQTFHLETVLHLAR
jgi:23S rRNA (uracil1939-C5)-methyltransferase